MPPKGLVRQASETVWPGINFVRSRVVPRVTMRDRLFCDPKDHRGRIFALRAAAASLSRGFRQSRAVTLTARLPLPHRLRAACRPRPPGGACGVGGGSPGRCTGHRRRPAPARRARPGARAWWPGSVGGLLVGLDKRLRQRSLPSARVAGVRLTVSKSRAAAWSGRRQLKPGARRQRAATKQKEFSEKERNEKPATRCTTMQEDCEGWVYRHELGSTR